MNRIKYYKIIFFLLIFFVIAVFVSEYFIFTDIRNKNKNISSLLGSLSSKNNKEAYVNSTNKYLKEKISDIDLMDKTIIPSDEVAGFIENLESTAKLNGLKLSIVSLIEEDSPNLPKNITNLRIKATAEGTWSGSYRFLGEIQFSDFSTKVNQFVLSNETSQNTSSKKVIQNKWNSLIDISVLKYK